MKYLAVRNWEKFQHYKGQNTPLWIKFYRDLLSDYEFNQLSELDRGRLMRLWLLAAATRNRIPKDARWVAQQIGAKTIDLDLFLSRGFLEEVYSPSREPLALTEQRREDNIEQQSRTDAHAPSEAALTRLLDSLTDKDLNTERTIRKVVRQHKLVEADIAWARECATGPGVNSPAGVAVAELKKRGQAKEAAA